MISLEQRIDYLPLNDRPKIIWPNKARLAFWVVPNVEFYDYMPPAKAKRKDRGFDNPVFPSPDIQGNIRRDYGNRVGFWRMVKVLDKYNIRCTVNINLAVLERLPEERSAMIERNWDFCCHGMYNSRSEPKGLALEEQRAFVKECIAVLQRTTGKKLKGCNVLSRATPELPDILAEEGLIYHADYLHDDQPMPIRVKQGRLVSVPYGGEINDSAMTSRNRAWEADDLLEAAKDAFDRLYEEGAENGMVLCLALHPWCSGYPYRIKYLDKILDYIMSHAGVWQTTADDIAEYYLANYHDQAIAYADRLKVVAGNR